MSKRKKHKRLDIQEIVSSNPKVDVELLTKSHQALNMVRAMGVRPVQFGQIPPFAQAGPSQGQAGIRDARKRAVYITKG